MVSKRGNIQHIEVNVSDLNKSKAFYEDLLAWLGYRPVLDEKEVVGWGNGNMQIFLVKCGNRFVESGFHRKRVGLNHIAFRAMSEEDVKKFHKQFLVPRRVKVLYGGPKHYPEYGPNYFSVYFEDPDRIKLELVHGVQ